MFAYLDNSATTKPCPEAVAAMVEALETGWGNPSSLYRFGMDAARRLKAAREQVAKALGCNHCFKRRFLNSESIPTHLIREFHSPPVIYNIINHKNI